MMTTLRISPDTLVLAFLSERTQATAPAIQAACRMTPGTVRSRLAHLESLRHITSRQGARLVPPARAFMITGRQIRGPCTSSRLMGAANWRVASLGLLPPPSIRHAAKNRGDELR